MGCICLKSDNGWDEDCPIHGLAASAASEAGKRPDAAPPKEDDVFEVYASISVLRCDEKPLTEKDRDETLDRIALAIGDASDDSYTFIALVSPAVTPLASPPPSDAAPVALMMQIHDVLIAVEPFIEFEEPDVSAVALRSEVVSLTHLLANRMAAHPEDAPGGPSEQA